MSLCFMFWNKMQKLMVVDYDDDDDDTFVVE